VLIHKQQTRIGCSGWQYRHWRGEFYPDGLPQARQFGFYAATFDTVEVNNSFYRLPPAETFAKWREQAPQNFRYAIKASRFLTHMKKLKDPEASLERLFEHTRELGPTLGAILYQLPPNFAINIDRLAGFLEAIKTMARRTGLPKAYHVVEFRDSSWYVDDIYALLERHDVALCLHDMPGSATARVVVGPCVYVRFHGGTSKYGGRYDDLRLDRWGDWLIERVRAGLDVFAYFNNDVGGHAPRDAIRLRTRVANASRAILQESNMRRR
jgi:uncharacterized protein YecE (DUF72 family)